MEIKKRTHLSLRNYILHHKIDINSSLFKILKFLFNKTLNQKGYLLTLKIDITNRCNLKCKFCYNLRNKKQLSLKYILNTINSLKDCRISLLGGEPLLRKDIFQIINNIKKRKLQCTLFTNGTLISKKIALKLKRAKLDNAIVTLFSNSKIDHDEFTQSKDSWEKTIKGIKNLVDVGIKTYTHTVITNKNVNKLKEISSLAKSLGASPLFFRYVPKHKKDPLLVKNPKKIRDVQRWILYKKSKKHGEFIRAMVSLTGRNCLGGYHMLSIKSNGDVTPCPFIYDIKLGNIKKQNIQKIFNERFSKKEFCEFFYTPNECKNCSFVEFCKGGCRASNKKFLKEYNKKDHQCQGPWKINPNKENICKYLPFWW